MSTRSDPKSSSKNSAGGSGSFGSTGSTGAGSASACRCATTASKTCPVMSICAGAAAGTGTTLYPSSRAPSRRATTSPLTGRPDDARFWPQPSDGKTAAKCCATFSVNAASSSPAGRPSFASSAVCAADHSDTTGAGATAPPDGTGGFHTSWSGGSVNACPNWN